MLLSWIDATTCRRHEDDTISMYTINQPVQPTRPENQHRQTNTLLIPTQSPKSRIRTEYVYALYEPQAYPYSAPCAAQPFERLALQTASPSVLGRSLRQKCITNQRHVHLQRCRPCSFCPSFFSQARSPTPEAMCRHPCHPTCAGAPGPPRVWSSRGRPTKQTSALQS
jgi:hypothetical protein